MGPVITGRFSRCPPRSGLATGLIFASVLLQNGSLRAVGSKCEGVVLPWSICQFVTLVRAAPRWASHQLIKNVFERTLIVYQ